MSFPQQIDLDGGLHDVAPVHERLRLFAPAPAQLAGQTHLDTDNERHDMNLTMQTVGESTFTIARRTFEACEHPAGSAERARLNECSETSEYLPSRRYTLRGPHFTTSYATKREAEAELARIVSDRA